MDTQSRLEHLRAGYAAAGLPLTLQRRTLLEVLASRKDHPTVDQIYAALAERVPEVSRTTAYRSLEVLAGLGLLRKVEHPGSAVRFDSNPTAHHHFLCRECGGLSDLPTDALTGTSELSFAGVGDARAEELTVLVRGLCADC